MGIPIAQCNPSEFLESSYLQEYEEAIDLIWKELLRLNSYLFILNKILQFPSGLQYLFLGPEKQTFLELVSISFTESSILIISKLTTPARDRFSIQRLHKRVREHIKEEYKSDFDALMKKVEYKKTVNTSHKNVGQARDNVIAHLIVDENMRPALSNREFAFQELQQMADGLTKLFDALCFGHRYSVFPLDYSPLVQHPLGTDTRSDIEYFLDLMIQDSYLFNMPDGPYWDEERKSLSPEILGILNQYRRKFGKPEV